MNNQSSGFTLIELLVVIAIIGILSSIMLVSLNSARNRATNSRVISDMSQIRALASTLYKSGATNTYEDIECDTYAANSTGCADSSMKKLYDDIYGQGGSLIVNVSGDKYCAQAVLPKGGDSFCVDSEGYAGRDSVTCDATGCDCD